MTGNNLAARSRCVWREVDSNEAQRAPKLRHSQTWAIDLPVENVLGVIQQGIAGEVNRMIILICQ